MTGMIVIATGSCRPINLTGGIIDFKTPNATVVFKCGGRTLNIFDDTGTVKLGPNVTVGLHTCNSSFFKDYETIRSIVTGADVLGAVFGPAASARFLVEDSIVFWWPQVRRPSIAACNQE